jgi:hypothetical protein
LWRTRRGEHRVANTAAALQAGCIVLTQVNLPHASDIPLFFEADRLTDCRRIAGG